ncbi:methionyl-tRNA formyltransferase [Carboxylicivirga caseinilyticus]|uniref:methionyl-tRNA formyltransferase n=1 Tax=Carboxylicivirga caseinilyticus TaxID=3417572 RepID=UPI003D3446DB|nr:methionyl-tRNA formyltransferase [Marinilabiliaceae bacterium A049]
MEDRNLRIVFMGTPDFAVESLKALVENKFNVVGVITAPDRPAGRGQKLTQSPVKEYAVEVGLPVLQPEKLKNEDFLNQLRDLKADLQVIVAFRMLPEVVWNMPRLGSLNLHGSLLPQYRGAAPINWAVINGDKKTGVTTFFLQHEIDTGNIIMQEEMPILDDDTAGSVHDKMMVLGAEVILKTVDAIHKNEVKAVPQNEFSNESELRPAPKIFKEDCKIDWNNSSEAIRNKIRGLSPYPTAWTELEMNNGKLISIKIFNAIISDKLQLKPGTIESDNKTFIAIGTNDKAILITDIQLAGKKRMLTQELLRGFDSEQIKGIK